MDKLLFADKMLHGLPTGIRYFRLPVYLRIFKNESQQSQVITADKRQEIDDR